MNWINPENNLVGAVKQIQGILQDGYKVPKPKVVKVKPTVFPPSLDIYTFHKAWDRWVIFRSEKNKKLTPSTIDSQLKKLSKCKVETAIAMIEQTIEKGWIGLFKLDEEDSKPQPKSADELQIIQWEKNRDWVASSSLATLQGHSGFMSNLKNPKYRKWAENVNVVVKEIVL